MADRPYHHGDLRSALLTRAEHTLRESGVDGLSLRELARDIGVSHAAPRRHFRDKAALLDALATEGFHRLGKALERATHTEQESFVAMLTDVAVSYVQFATESPALLELMFTSKHGADASAELHAAAGATFSQLEALVSRGQQQGELIDGDLELIGTVLFATLQGITSLANTQMVDRSALDQLTAYAVQSLLTGLAPRRRSAQPVG
ncbi:MAG: TetR/AcrR family transcriptional regulator [Propionibacteriaceae bacterium]